MNRLARRSGKFDGPAGQFLAENVPAGLDEVPHAADGILEIALATVQMLGHQIFDPVEFSMQAFLVPVLGDQMFES